jgi:hypothetical protein
VVEIFGGPNPGIDAIRWLIRTYIAIRAFVSVFGADGEVLLAEFCDVHTVKCYGGAFQPWERRLLDNEALELFDFQDQGSLPLTPVDSMLEERSLGSCPMSVLYPCIDTDCFSSCTVVELPICLLSQANCLLSTVDGFSFPFMSDLPGVAMMLFGQTGDVELVRFVSPLLVYSGYILIPIPIPPGEFLQSRTGIHSQFTTP